jgi:hypothetical protein
LKGWKGFSKGFEASGLGDSAVVLGLGLVLVWCDDYMTSSVLVLMLPLFTSDPWLSYFASSFTFMLFFALCGSLMLSAWCSTLILPVLYAVCIVGCCALLVCVCFVPRLCAAVSLVVLGGKVIFYGVFFACC